jgi:hypothetical protein
VELLPVSEPRNVDDVDYVESTDPSQARPMREVLAQRARDHNAQDKATRERAFRERAGMQAVLQSCLCLVPLVKYDTPSGHDQWCPGHGIWLSQQEVRKRYG